MNTDKTRAAICVYLCLSVAAVQAVQAQHLGVYHWAGEVDSLPRAAAALPRFRFDTLRIFLGGKYDYIHAENSPERFGHRKLKLAEIAALPRYRAVIGDPKIHTVWLTAYPVFDYGKGPAEIDLRAAKPDWQEESRQMRELVEWLYRRYGAQQRVILISNNETDEKLREVGPPANVIRDLAVRMQAVEETRAKFPQAKLKVLFGVEIKLWRLGDATRALDSVLPKLHYDFVSFSAWEAVAHPEVLGDALDDIARRTREHTSQEGRALFGDHQVLIGEFGHAREWPQPAASVLKPFLDAVATGRTPYAIYWQLYDNHAGEVKKFGLLDIRDRLTPEGKDLLKTRIASPSRSRDILTK